MKTKNDIAPAAKVKVKATLAFPPATDELSYVQFFNNNIGSRSGMEADEIAEELGGGIQLGCPILRVGEDTVYNASGLGFVILESHDSWYQGSKEDPDVVSLEEQDTGYESDWNRSVQALLLLLPGEKPLPLDLQPAVLTITTFSKWTQVKAPDKHARAIAKGQTARFAEKHGDLVTRVKPEFRQVSSFGVRPHTVKSGPNKGTPYAQIVSKAKPITLQQIEALNAYQANPACQAREKVLRKTFAERVADRVERAAE